MKNFRDYLKESEQAAHQPVVGDTFAINIREECLIESVVVESRDDGVVIAADERTMQLLESYGYTFEENCMECGMMECGCDQDPEQYGDETDAGQDPGEYDYEGDMAKDELYTMIRSARKLIGMLDNDDNMPEWTQKKINKATDYVDTASDYISSKKERGVMEDDAEPNPVARATLHRIMMAHPGVLATHGPERVMDAVDELADHVGNVDEIGSSDVSGWVRDVIRMLAELPDEPMNVGDDLDEQDVAEGYVQDPEHAEYLKRQADISRSTGLVVGDRVTLKDRPGFEGEIVHDWGGGDFTISGSGGGMSPSKNHRANARLIQKIQGMAEGAEQLHPETLELIDEYISKIEPDADRSEMIQSVIDGTIHTSELEYALQDDVTEAEYQGRKVPLGKPMAGDVKKSKVYVKNPQGRVVKVNFGQKGMKIKKSIPGRRKNFRARHNCDNPGPRHKARYWSCRAW